jgi:hypothetical protein
MGTLVYVMLVFFVREGVPHARAEIVPSLQYCRSQAMEILDGLRGDARFSDVNITCSTYTTFRRA